MISRTLRRLTAPLIGLALVLTVASWASVAPDQAKGPAGWLSLPGLSQALSVGTVLDQARCATATVNVQHIDQAIRMEILAGQKVPRDLAVLVPQRSSGGKLLDPWGTPFLLEVEAEGYQVAAAGPDRKHGTKDDIVARTAIPGAPKLFK